MGDKFLLTSSIRRTQSLRQVCLTTMFVSRDALVLEMELSCIPGAIARAIPTRHFQVVALRELSAQMEGKRCAVSLMHNNELSAVRCNALLARTIQGPVTYYGACTC